MYLELILYQIMTSRINMLPKLAMKMCAFVYCLHSIFTLVFSECFPPPLLLLSKLMAQKLRNLNIPVTVVLDAAVG